MSPISRYSPTKLCDGAKMEIFLRPVFPASRVQHISYLHSKFALGPHHVWKYGIDIQSAAAGIRRRKKKKKERKIETTGQKIMSAAATQGGHNKRRNLTVANSSRVSGSGKVATRNCILKG